MKLGQINKYKYMFREDNQYCYLSLGGYQNLYYLTKKYLMQRYSKSDFKLPAISSKYSSLPSNNINSSVKSLQKPKSIQIQSQKNQPNSLISMKIIPKSKRTSILLKQIKPYNKQETESEEDVNAIMKRISSPVRKPNPAQLIILKKNLDKKTYLQNQYIKQSLIGEEAVQKFYSRYKNIDKAKSYEKFFKKANTMTKILQLLQCHQFTPRKLDIIKVRGQQAILQLKKLGLGRGSMGSVVSQIMKQMDHFEAVNLSHNQIDRLSSEFIIQHLGKVVSIDLSSNRIGKVGCTKFAQLFLSSNTRIENLNLKENNLLDNAGVYVVQHLVKYNKLKRLNMSKNFMGSKFAQKIKDLLSQNSQLIELYISWNQFNEKSTKSIFQGMLQNSSLKVFDYSWNKVSEANAEIAAKFFKTNTSLIHVDLAFCQINKEGTNKIAQALKGNHTIYGFHYQGNSGIVDAKGFLQTTQKQHFQYPLPIIRGVLRSIDGVKPNPIDNQYREILPRDICWICSSWQQIHFKIPQKQYSQSTQCYVHLQHENYIPIKMELVNQKYQVYRMCPRRQLVFFFTVILGPGKRQHFLRQEFKKIKGKQISFMLGKAKIKHQFIQLNAYQLGYISDPIDEDFYPTINSQPRFDDTQALYREKIKVRKVNRKKVVVQQKLDVQFRELDQNQSEIQRDELSRDDDINFIRSCLEFDIANSKISRILKKPQDLHFLRNYMQRVYIDFKDCYYYLANSNPNLNGIFSIPQFALEKFLEEQKYVTKRVTLAKLRVKLYATLSNGDEQSINNKKATDSMKLLLRPQFLEFLVRLALQKWCVIIPKPKLKDEVKQKQKQQKQQQEPQQKKLKLKLPLTICQGIERTMKTLTKYAARVRASNWRVRKFLKIEANTVTKAYETVLLNLFEKYSNSKTKLKRNKKLAGLMILEQFKNIFLQTQIKRTKQSLKEAEVCFLDSKRLQIQDGVYEYGLNFEEFTQCLARISQFIWFPPVAEQKHTIWDFQPNRKHVPMFIKYEALIVNIYRKIPDLQNPRLNRIMQKGIFVQQMQVLPDKVQQFALRTGFNFMFRVNSLIVNEQQKNDDEITLKMLVQMLKQKYKNAVIHREEYIQQSQEQEIQL